MDGLYLRTIQLVVVLFVLNVGFASSIDNSFLLLGRFWRFGLLGELALLALAYRAWRAPRVRLPPAVLAAAAGLVALALLSTAWSADPGLTVRRTLAFGLLLLTGLALAHVAGEHPLVAGRVLDALLVAAVLVALLGLYVLWVSHDLAVQPASTQYPARYRGLGQNPNTAAMLLALAVPLALARARRPALLAAVLLLLDGSIVASGSRGALLAALAGACLWLATSRRSLSRRLVLVAAAAAVFAADVVVMQMPKALEPAPAAAAASTRPAKPVRDAELVDPLADEIGRPRSGGAIHRTLFGTSGRARAWDAALHQAGERPVAGYGFGTESVVFADRYYGFDSSVPENSYIGFLLQLGVVGLLALLVLLAVLAAIAIRAVRALGGEARRLARVCAAVFGAGLVLALTQSYLTSVGNLASSSVWLSALLVPGLLAAATSRASAQPAKAR